MAARELEVLAVGPVPDVLTELCVPTEVPGAVAAVRRLRTSRPELVVCGLDLFDGSGLEVLSVVQETWGPRVPVVLLARRVDRAAAVLELRPHLLLREPDGAVASLVTRVLDGRWDLRLDVVDYALLALAGTHSVVLEIAGAGRITIQSHRAWAAVDASGRGIDAFHRLARIRGPRISCTTASADARIGNVGVPIEDALAELLEPAPVSTERSLGFTGVSGAQGRRGGISAPRTLDGMPAVASFEALLERAIELLLEKNYPAAFRVLTQARALRADHAMVRANLTRLEEMGFGRG